MRCLQSLLLTFACICPLPSGLAHTLTAAGAGSGSDLRVQGSSLRAGQDINLAADNRIDLVAAQSTTEQHSSKSSSSASVGFSIGTTA